MLKGPWKILCGGGKKWNFIHPVLSQYSVFWKVVESSKSVGRFRLCFAYLECASLDQDSALVLLCRKHTLKHIWNAYIKILLDAFVTPFALVTYLCSPWINNVSTYTAETHSLCVSLHCNIILPVSLLWESLKCLFPSCCHSLQHSSVRLMSSWFSQMCILLPLLPL